MGEYSKYFLMDERSAARFVKENTDFFTDEEEVTAREVGDGNINYVFIVKSRSSAASLAIKQADVLLRSSGRALDTRRIEIEAMMLEKQNSLCPTSVPKVYLYSPTMHAIIMEDISSYKNLGKEIENERLPAHFAESITTFLTQTLLPTTDLVMGRKEKKEALRTFINPDMCDISEELVFNEPYTDCKKRNVISAGLLSFVRERLYENEEVKTHVSHLRNSFMNNAQALLHGDLHTGSIFVNDKGIKVIDCEFAFYGPIGYDAGNVTAHLVIALTKRLVLRAESAFTAALEKAVEEIIDLLVQKFMVFLEKNVKEAIYTHLFFKEYVEAIISDTAGFAGCEIIRRVVGDAKVRELTSITSSEERREVEKVLIDFALSLIVLRKEVKKGQDVMKLFREGMERYGYK